MKRIVWLAAGLVAFGRADAQAAPIYGVTIPDGYRDWTMISLGAVGGNVNDLRVKLGNIIAIKAYRASKLPFPDGTIIARLAYTKVPSKDLPESFAAGSPTNLEFMIKDSKKYASTGGWGFGQFTNGKPDSEALHKTCFACHAPAKDHDFVFTRYAP
jgi:hypothetical protein